MSQNNDQLCTRIFLRAFTWDDGTPEWANMPENMECKRWVSTRLPLAQAEQLDDVDTLVVERIASTLTRPDEDEAHLLFLTPLDLQALLRRGGLDVSPPILTPGAHAVLYIAWPGGPEQSAGRGRVLVKFFSTVSLDGVAENMCGLGTFDVDVNRYPLWDPQPAHANARFMPRANRLYACAE